MNLVSDEGDIMRKIEIDRSMKELLQYRDLRFPLEIWTDDYTLLADHTLNCHWHHEYEYGVVLTGELDYFLNGTKLKLKKGDCIFVNANVLHMAEQSAGCSKAVMYIVAFPYMLLTSNMESTIYRKYFNPLIENGISGFQIFSDSQAGSNILSVLEQLYRIFQTEEDYELSCLGLVCQLWNETRKYAAQKNVFLQHEKVNVQDEERAKTILYYIREHFSETLSVEEIVEKCNISRSECFRCFKRFTNKSPVMYLNEYRLAQAAKKLLATSDPITQIALDCGFSTSSYFCKLFREKYKISPLQYRKTPLEGG